MYRSGLKCLALIGVPAMLALPAMAATSASAGVSGLSFELVDLDLNDGIAASISWSAQSAFSQADRQHGQVFEFFPQPDGSVSWAVSYTGSESQSGDSATDFVSAALLPDGTHASTGQSAVSTGAATVDGGQSFTSTSMMMGGFTLSANTELRLTGTASTAISGSGSANTVLPSGVDLPLGLLFSQSSTYLGVSLGESWFSSNLNGQSFVASADPVSYPTADYGDSATSFFSLSMRNDSGASMDGLFSVIAQSTMSQLAVSPVPEPGPLSMALAGLGVLAIVSRRARRQP